MPRPVLNPLCYGLIKLAATILSSTVYITLYSDLATVRDGTILVLFMFDSIFEIYSTVRFIRDTLLKHAGDRAYVPIK